MRRLLSTRPLAAGLGLMAALALSTLSGPASLAADGAPAPKPAKKDSPKALQPRAARFTATVEPAEARPGETVTYRVAVQLNPGWHIYSYAQIQPEDGPRRTTFDFFDTAGLKPVGEWTPSRPPVRKHDPNFKEIPFLEFYEEEVAWSHKLTVPPDAEPGKKALRCQVGYQLCDANNCTPPGQWTQPEVALTILAAGPKTGAGVPTAAAPTPTAPAGDAPAPGPAVVATDAGSRELAPDSADLGSPAILSTGPKSEVEREIEKGIFPFLLLSAGAGLLALVMPCVWPMVPITVNFFVKQGQSQANTGRGTTGLAIVYCLAIIGIFTGVGVLFSALLGASAAQGLATNAWFNLVVALLFLAFGLSLLGLFEISLPTSFLNASARGEGRGGLVGVMFMALTLTITSFTCTFPVVGGLLVMAAKGSYLYPVIGLATFSSVLALPFFLMALAPGMMARLPRSGDWMNAVKVVGGLLEFGAAFKFLNNAEIGFGTAPEDAWTNAPTVLSLWVVLALVCGIYLLGLFRTDHDLDDIKVGPGRLLAGALFLFLALFLAPALFGRPPQSPIWNRMVVGLLPPDVGRLASASALAATSGGEAEKFATSRDPNEAVRQQVSVHGVPWVWSYEMALERAAAEGKPVLIDFTGVYCTNCRSMEQGVMPRPEVVEQLKRFVTVQLYTDLVPIKSLRLEDQERLAGANALRQSKIAGEVTNPFYVVLSPRGEVLETIGGFREPPAFVEFLKRGRAKFDGAPRVSATGPAPLMLGD